MSHLFDLEKSRNYSPTLAFKQQSQSVELNKMSESTTTTPATAATNVLNPKDPSTNQLPSSNKSSLISHIGNLPFAQRTNDSLNTSSGIANLQANSSIHEENIHKGNPFINSTAIDYATNLTKPSNLPIKSVSLTEPTLPKINSERLNYLNTPRTSNISMEKKAPSIIASKFLLNVNNSNSEVTNKKESELAFDTVPNTVSMASIPIVNKNGVKSQSMGFINLTSDEESDEDISFANIAGIKSTTVPTAHDVKYESNQEKLPVSNTLKKFTYHDSDDNSDSDDDDDDDIIITGVGHNATAPLNNSALNALDIKPVLPLQPIKTEAVKRERSIEDEMELNRKRQEIMKNKISLVENNVKKENAFQDLLKVKAKTEKEKLERERINKLLENYPPIKGLPTKYLIEFPKSSSYISVPNPILPNIITATEVEQEIVVKSLPREYKVTVYRWENINAMYSANHRLNKLSDLHTRLDVFLKSAAGMRNLVHQKAIKTAGIKKADIRYNQILRFMDARIKSLASYYGDIGTEIYKMKKLKTEIMERAKKMDDIRRLFIMSGRLTGSVPPYKTLLNCVSQMNLVLNTITEMCRLSGDQASERIKLIRGFSLNSHKLPPMIEIPQVIPSIMPRSSNEGALSHVASNIDSYYDLVNNGDDDDEGFVPMSNVYADNMTRMNPYNANLNDTDGIKNLMNSIKVTEIKEDGLANTPDELCISLLKHQRIGLSWMLKIEESANKGGILADDMGLGKTIQAISLLLANPSKDEKDKTTLIVGPVSLLHQWQQEINMKIKTEKKITTYLFHSTNKVKTFAELAQYDIVLVSYQTLASQWKKHYAREIEMAKKFGGNKSKLNNMKHFVSPFYARESIFYRIILDEAQYIKNRQTDTSKSVASLSSTYRWCLSGTPIQNGIDELYPLLRFLGIKPYNDWNKFNTYISSPTKHNRSSGVRKIHAILSAILLRRTKDSEIDGKPILSLPEKHVIEEEVVMGEDEKEFYNSLELLSQKKADKLLKSTKRSAKSYSSILTLLLRLRQATDHEFLVRLGDDGDRTEKLERFTKGFEAIKDFSNNTLDRIDNEMETGFTCVNCYQELAESQVLLLSKCGHAICYDCHNEYFEENSETVFDGDISAKCPKCEILNSSSRSVDLKLYQAYQEGLSWSEIRKRFDLDSKASDKNWRARMIQEFIDIDLGFKASAKMKKTMELIQNILTNKPGEKVIIFSQFMAFFDVMKMELREKGVDFLQYDGSMDMGTKNDCVTAFYKNPNKKVLLLSLRAGNVGLTLTCANHVIIAEPFWNPYVEKQAQDRVHRISQTKEVFVHRLLIKGSVEDRIMELQKQKEEIVEGALDPTARNKINKLSRRELGFLFGLNGLAELEDE